MDEHRDNLTHARRAYAARDWRTAAAHFDAVATERLTADDLAAYADAAWWLGRIKDTLRLSAAACDAFLADSRPVEAAWAAMVLGIFHMGRGDEPQGMGWIGRAGRLLEGIPECPVHGYLLHLTEVETSLQAGRPAAAVDVDAARRIRDLGHCHIIAACHEVADIRRMTRWIELTERWLATFPAAVAFEGLCAVHRAQLHLFRCEGDEAERKALRVGADLDANRIDYAAYWSAPHRMWRACRMPSGLLDRHPFRTVVGSPALVHGCAAGDRVAPWRVRARPPRTGGLRSSALRSFTGVTRCGRRPASWVCRVRICAARTALDVSGPRCGR